MGVVFWLALILPVIGFGAAYASRRLRPNADIPAPIEGILWVLPSIIILLIIWFSVRASMTHDREYWNGWATHMIYTEQEWRTETYTETYTDAKGKTQTRTRTRIVYYPPSWTLYDDIGSSHGLSEKEYRSIAGQWGNPHPPSGGSSGASHWVKWDGNKQSGIPITCRHSYTNKTLACHTVFNFRELSKEEAKELYPWPGMVNDWHAPMILGYRGADEAKVDRMLAELNADLGKSKQVRVHVLVFYGKDASIAELQREYWKGGKKNELNICLGLDTDNKMEWCRVFSWSESEDLKSEIANHLEPGQAIDWDAFLRFVRQGIESKWQRKSFKDFDYLSVELPAWAVGLAWGLSLLSVLVLLGFRLDW